MYRNFPAPTPRLLDGEPRIVEPTLVKEFSRAVGPGAPRQHGDRINGEPEVILASPQGILRHQISRKQFFFSGGVRGLFQLSFHGAASTAFKHTFNIHHILAKTCTYQVPYIFANSLPTFATRSTSIFAPIRAKPRIAVECDSASSLITEVETGRGIALSSTIFKLVAGRRLLYRPLTGTTEVASVASPEPQTVM